jgi:tetratricopeptide (TPR) repeat protein
MLKPAAEQLDPACPEKPALLTRLAVWELSQSEFDGALKHAVEALEIGAHYRTITSQDAGVAHFLCGTVQSNNGDIESAERSFRSAIQAFRVLGDFNRPAVARSEADLALLYIRTGRLKQAETALEASLREEQAGSMPDEERLIRLDSVIHLQCRKGRFTDALHTTERMLARYGESDLVTTSMRAHLYRDRGELLLITGDPDGAEKCLRRSMELMDRSGRLPEFPTALVLLGRVKMMRNDTAQAEKYYAAAADAMQPLAEAFPENAVEIACVFGEFLGSQHRWKEAYESLQTDLVLLHSPGVDSDSASRFLTDLANADHHLHKRSEEKDAREQAKAFTALQSNPPESNQTVDILTLRAQR